MFESTELGQKVEKLVFERREPDLRTRLLCAQQELHEKKIPAIVIVAGVEGAGKGDFVNRIHKWLDVRGLRTHSFCRDVHGETDRPYYWRFWQALPPAGSIAIMFGAWYGQHLVDRVLERESSAEYEIRLRQIVDFEKLLTDDGMLVVKFWFHLTRKQQKERLKKDREAGRVLSPDAKFCADHHDLVIRHAEHAIRVTDAGSCSWHIVESTDHRYRDLTAGEILLEAFNARLKGVRPVATEPSKAETGSAPLTVLDRIDLSQNLSSRAYEKQLAACQSRLWNLAWQAHASRVNTVVVLEGWDAAGKGSALRRLTQAIDARLYQTISVAAPTDEERAHHYLWRFWRHVPPAGHITFYDRSWYGRVLVERVEGFARAAEWKRAFHEIISFEEQLVEHGIVLLKFWIHITKEEQLRRFDEREQTEWKQYKITGDDWRNRDKWDSYASAVNDMITHTSTARAPWTLIAGNDKRHARVTILDAVCSALEHRLETAG